MKVVYLPKGKGKTPALLNWLQSAPEGEWRVGVFQSLDEAHRQMRLAYEDGAIPSKYETWQFLSIYDITRGSDALLSDVRLRGGSIVLGIDNVDLILEQLIGWQIGMVTATDHDPYATPAVWVHPGRYHGEPCVDGHRLPTQMIAEHVFDGTGDSAEDTWDITTHEVLVACWFEARYGKSRKIRKYWADWLEATGPILWKSKPQDWDRVPLPPAYVKNP